MSEAANLVFQWISVLNSVKHKFHPMSIVNLGYISFQVSSKHPLTFNCIDIKNKNKSTRK